MQNKLACAVLVVDGVLVVQHDLFFYCLLLHVEIRRIIGPWRVGSLFHSWLQSLTTILVVNSTD